MNLPMIDLFRALLKQERPALIIDMKVAEFQQLSAVTCKYEKNGRYLVAVSFFTATWIGKDPCGPRGNKEINPCDDLSDIAVIRECQSFTACKGFPVISITDLRDYIFDIKNKTMHLFDGLFLNNQYGDSVQASVSFAPAPTITVAIMQGTSLIGTLAVLFSGIVVPIFVCNSRIYDYAEEMRRLFTNVTSVVLPGNLTAFRQVTHLELGG